MEEQFVPSVLIANIALMSMLGVITIAIMVVTHRVVRMAST